MVVQTVFAFDYLPVKQSLFVVQAVHSYYFAALHYLVAVVLHYYLPELQHPDVVKAVLY